MIEKNNEKKRAPRSKAHEIPKQCMHTLKRPLSRCENVSKAIRKKGYNAHATLNGLATDYVSQMNNKVMAN